MRIKAIVLTMCAATFAFSQNSSDFIAENDFGNDIISNSNIEIDNNGYNFDILDAGVNTKYSEFGSGFFMNKLIMVSS